MNGTQAINRALALLGHFTDERPQWQVPELATAAGLNRTTTYRILTALEEAGVVVRDNATDLYRLGSELIVWGGRAQRANRLRTAALPTLRQLATEIGETATLELLQGDEVLVIEEVLGEHVLSSAQSVGTRWPINATSTGRAMWAYLPADQQARLLAQPWASFTAHTLHHDAALRAALATVREHGYAIVQEELELGYTAVSAPIFNHEAAVLAALSVGGASVRLVPRLHALGEQLRGAAVLISYQLGYRGA